MDRDQVALAAIAGAHGVGGEVRLKLFAQDLDSLRRHKQVRAGERCLTLTALRDAKQPIARFAEMKALDEQVKSLEESLETRKLVDRAKGILMDECDMKENDAFSWIQKTAMNERVKAADIADRVIHEGLRPA